MKDIKIFKLSASFSGQTQSLQEALEDKGRPHGLLGISYNGLLFAVPLRSNLKHKHGVILDRKEGKARGLDFTKCLLITDQSTQLDHSQPFSLPKNQWNAIINLKAMIQKKFEKYVAQYVNAHAKGVENTLRGPAYKYSTLVNYHNELGLL